MSEKTTVDPQHSAAADAFAIRVLDHVDWAISKTHGHWFVDHHIFKSVVSVAVAFNVFQMGLEANHPELGLWRACEHLFTAFFLTEMVLRILCLRTDYWRDFWNLFEGALALLAVAGVWVMPAIDDAGVEFNLRSFSLLRMLRVLRLARILRLVKRLRGLGVVLSGIVEAMEATFWVAAVMMFAIYIAAIFCVSAFRVQPGGGDSGYGGYSTEAADILEIEIIAEFNPYMYFGSVQRSMLTLFQLAILAEWSEVVRPVMEQDPVLVVFFVSFSIFVTFGILNVMIAMIVDRVLENARTIEAENNNLAKSQKLTLLKDLQSIIMKLDRKGSGHIGLAELDTELHDKDSELYALLAKVNLPRGLSAKELVYFLDDEGDTKVGYEEFVQSFYRMIECDSFQQMCLTQIGINSVKAHFKQAHDETRRHLANLEVLLAREFDVGSIPHTTRAVVPDGGVPEEEHPKAATISAALLKSSNTQSLNGRAGGLVVTFDADLEQEDAEVIDAEVRGARQESRRAPGSESAAFEANTVTPQMADFKELWCSVEQSILTSVRSILAEGFESFTSLPDLGLAAAHGNLVAEAGVGIAVGCRSPCERRGPVVAMHARGRLRERLCL